MNGKVMQLGNFSVEVFGTRFVIRYESDVIAAWRDYRLYTTSEYNAFDYQSLSYIPDRIDRGIWTLNRSLELARECSHLGWTPDENLSYWLRDYIVEKVRELDED